MNNQDASFFRNFQTKIFKDLSVMQLCRVVSIAGKRASVQPLALKSDGSKRAMILGAHITKQCFKCHANCLCSDIKIGDVVIVGFCDRDIDNYRNNSDFTLSTSRMHSINDAVILGVL